MGNYISKKVTPLRRPSFGNLDQSIAVGEEITESAQQIDLESETNGHDLKNINSSVNDTNGIEQNNHEDNEDELNENGQIDKETNGHSNGHTNGYTNGHANGHSNGNHSNGNDNEEVNEEVDNQKEEDLNDEHFNNIKLDKQYSNKKINLIKEDQEPEIEEDEEFEIVGRKKRGKRSAAPKKQYKKRKNDVQKVIDIEVNE